MSHIFEQFCAPLKRRPLQCGVSRAYRYATGQSLDFLFCYHNTVRFYIFVIIQQDRLSYLYLYIYLYITVASSAIKVYTA